MSDKLPNNQETLLAIAVGLSAARAVYQRVGCYRCRNKRMDADREIAALVKRIEDHIGWPSDGANETVTEHSDSHPVRDGALGMAENCPPSG